MVSVPQDEIDMGWLTKMKYGLPSHEEPTSGALLYTTSYAMHFLQSGYQASSAPHMEGPTRQSRPLRVFFEVKSSSLKGVKFRESSSQ
jgi:hypothetical protein